MQLWPLDGQHQEIARRCIVAAPVLPSEDELYRTTDAYLDGGVGGIMVGIGGRHPLLQVADGSAKRYVDHIRARNPGLIVAVDAEGGRIFNFLEGASPLQSPRSYVATGRERAFLEDVSRHVGVMSDLGANMNFAPLLDVAQPGYKGYPAADERAWSDDPGVVIEWAQRFCESHVRRGIAPVPKHFPGYGALETNPHEVLAEIDAGQLEQSLVPWRALAHDARAIMTGHVCTPIDYGVPASLSVQTEVFIRESLAFEGLTIADELFMRAVDQFLASSHRAVPAVGGRIAAALRANDMAIVSYPVQSADGTLAGRPDGPDRLPSLITDGARALKSMAIDPRRHQDALNRINAHAASHRDKPM